MMRLSGSTSIARFGMLLAAAVLVSYVESLIPMPRFFYGFKLGLVNAILLSVLYLVNARTAFLISVLRIILIGLLFGNLLSMLYSLAGGILSLLLMWAAKKSARFSVVGVSVLGGVSHNLGQLLIAAFILQMNQSSLLFYLSVLILLGLLTGTLIGLLTAKLLPYLKPLFQMKA